MSDYKCLDEWFPSGRGDGRKFCLENWGNGEWFEPIFNCRPDSDWHGLDKSGRHEYFHSYEVFKEYKEPKKTVKMYQAVINGSLYPYIYNRNLFESKEVLLKHFMASEVSGIIELEVELE